MIATGAAMDVPPSERPVTQEFGRVTPRWIDGGVAGPPGQVVVRASEAPANCHGREGVGIPCLPGAVIRETGRAAVRDGGSG